MSLAGCGASTAGCCCGIPLLCNLYGLWIRSRGQRRIDQSPGLRLHDADPKYATTDNGKIPGRSVEYFVYGEPNPDPSLPVLINLHGSGTEGWGEKMLHHDEAKHFGVKGISISWVGHGGTDVKPGRQVREWAAEDLEAVLRAESVGSFFITGHSSGNPHALCAAWHFGPRCVGLGLNSPCLDDLLVKAVNKEQPAQVLSPSAGQDSLPTQETAAKWYMGWYWAMLDIVLIKIGPPLLIQAIKVDEPEDNWYKEIMAKSFVRATARGGYGPAGLETCYDTCYVWGFDPREIPSKGCKHICVWHASDDTLAAADNGKWLAEYFKQQSGVIVDFRDDDVGCGHFTYSRGEFVKNPEKSMLKTMLGMWRGNYVPSKEENPIRKDGGKRAASKRK